MPKWLKILLGCFLALLLIWITINPMGRFGICFFGVTTYNAVPTFVKDLQVQPNGDSQSNEKTHELRLEAIQYLLKEKPEILIIGTGWNGQVKVDDAIRKLKGLQIIIENSGSAIERYNELKRQNKRVAIHLHSTC